MHWLLIGYMFLFIHRPFELWPMLGELHVERVYILGVIVAWAMWPGKRWIPNPQHFAYFAFATAVVLCWAMSPWADDGQVVVENWFKVLVFYVLLVTSASDEKALKRLVAGFLFVMAVYMLHSFREFLGGRYTFRMGIVRMIGVDSSLGDPNSFGASIVFALPFVRAFWQSCRSAAVRTALVGYLGLSLGCILLTGSRSSLLGLCVWWAWVIVRSRHRWLGIFVAAIAAPALFLALPESLQTRFETIVDPEVGPESARVSGEGRLEGFYKGMELFAANPATGIGPGSWRPATRSKLESHNLYGQLCGEMGLAGALTFAAILACFAVNLMWMRRTQKTDPAGPNAFEHHVASAVAMSVFLLLFMGNFGHNLFRHNWLWFGGFLIIARQVVATRHRAPATHAYSAPWPDRVVSWRVRVVRA
jgi:O-antigen ligase/polysaccharide polymerase Wzy-like membrane protein